MFGDRDASIEYARRVLENTPTITGAYFGYEPNADQADQESLGKVRAEAMDDSGRFIPYWFVVPGRGRVIELEPLVDMESSLYYQGAKEAFLQSKKAAPTITEPYVYQGKMIYEQVYPIVIDGRFMGVAGVDRALADVELPLRAIAEELLGQPLAQGEPELAGVVSLGRGVDGAWFRGRRSSLPMGLRA